MKKILTILALSGLASGAFAQGTVNWSGVVNLFIADTNSAGSSAVTPGATAGGPQATGATAGSTTTLFYYELLVSSSQTTAPTSVSTLASGWLDTGLEAQNGGSANGRILQLNSGTAVTANNWAVGATENVMLVGWSANIGTTYSAALQFLQAANYSGLTTPAFFGESSIGSLASNPGNPGVTIFGTSTGQINNGSGSPMIMGVVGPVPEPATMALAGLGGLSLLALRRKK